VYLDAAISSDGEGTRDWSDVIADTRSSNAENNYVNDKNISVIFKIINESLSDKERVIVRDKYLKGIPYTAIAKKMGLSHQTVNTAGEWAIYKLRKILADKLKSGEFENVDKENLIDKNHSRVAVLQSQKQRDRMSVSKRNPSQQTRKRLSTATAKFSIDVAIQAKKLLLSGKSQAQTAKELNISDSAVYKIYKNKLIYVRDGGVVFTPEDVAKIKYYEGINRFKNVVAMAKKNKLMRKEECKKLKMETGKSIVMKVITDSGPSETKTIEASPAPGCSISTIERMRRSFFN
jgi:DNA-binding CsgD family transcriptional regulator